MKSNVMVLCWLCLITMSLVGCAPEKPEAVRVGTIPENEIDPESWGKVYPLHYESFIY